MVKDYKKMSTRWKYKERGISTTSKSQRNSKNIKKINKKYYA